MVSTLDSSAQKFLTSLERIQNRIDTAQRQLSSGKRVQTAADAPDSVSELLQLHADLQHNQNVQAGLSSVHLEVSTSEQALSSAVDLAQRAAVLASAGAGPNQTPSTRAAISDEVTGLIDSMIGLTSTSASGKYVFSGDQDSLPTYQADAKSPSGWVRLQVATATRRISLPGANTFQPSLTANQIFDPRDSADQPTSDNILAALSGLKTALQSGDSSAIKDSLTSIQNAAGYLNRQLAFYGRAENTITDGLNQAQQESLRLTSRVSDLQDADATAAILEFTQAQTQLQAALSSRAQMPRKTLFDQL